MVGKVIISMPYSLAYIHYLYAIFNSLLQHPTTQIECYTRSIFSFNDISNYYIAVRTARAIGAIEQLDYRKKKKLSDDELHTAYIEDRKTNEAFQSKISRLLLSNLESNKISLLFNICFIDPSAQQTMNV